MFLKKKSKMTLKRMKLQEDSKKNMITELEALTLYAKVWNNMDLTIIEAHLAEEMIYESQVVMDPLVGKENFCNHMNRKINSISKSPPSAKVFAELGFIGDQSGAVIRVLESSEGRPFVILAQGDIDNVLTLILIKITQCKIARIDNCSVAPHPSTAIRTGKYPT